jgi:hypothetical protein
VRRKRLYELAPELEKRNIHIILIQIDEAHSSGWPNGLDTQPEPQSSFEERVNRANQYVDEEHPPFDVYVDPWNNAFAEKFKAWPDRFYMIDNELKVLNKAEFGETSDALVNYDYGDILRDIISSNEIESNEIESNEIES